MNDICSSDFCTFRPLPSLWKSMNDCTAPIIRLDLKRNNGRVNRNLFLLFTTGFTYSHHAMLIVYKYKESLTFLHDSFTPYDPGGSRSQSQINRNNPRTGSAYFRLRFLILHQCAKTTEKIPRECVYYTYVRSGLNKRVLDIYPRSSYRLLTKILCDPLWIYTARREPTLIGLSGTSSLA